MSFDKPLLSKYALDTDVVHITGAETVTGEKTFQNTVIVSDGTRTMEIDVNASQGEIKPSITPLVVSRSVAGKTQIVSQSNGAFDAEVIVRRGDDANASLNISQKATSTQLIPGASTTSIFVNPLGQDTDFVFRGDTDNNLLSVNAGNNNVGVGVSSTNTTAKLQVDSTTKGFLPPRMTTVQRDAIVSPAAGLIIFNLDNADIEYFNGVSWSLLGGSERVLEKVWSFSSPAGASGTTYAGGFYDFGGSDNDFSPSITHGVANNPYTAHFFIVLGSVPVDTLTIRVTGTSMSNLGVRTTSDTEDIVVGTGDSVDDYFETPKHWLGQVTISVVSGTPVACNYGYAKYWDDHNSDFVVRGWDATWTAGANDSSADIEVIHHRGTGWTFNSGSFPSHPSPIGSMATDYVTESDLVNNESGAWKRIDINEPIAGSASEGFILKVVTGANKAFEEANFALSITGGG